MRCSLRLATCRPGVWAAILLFALPASRAKADNIIPTEEFILPNRLRVLMHEDHRQPLVAIQVRYHTGAMNDPPNQAGMNALIDQLMWRWMGHLSPYTPWHYFVKSGSAGMRSWLDMHTTNYVVSVPAANLETALWIESDRMAFLFPYSWEGSQESVTDLAADELIRRQETVPYYKAYKNSLASLFTLVNPYHYGADGTPEQIRKISRAQAEKYYDAYYSPNNATLALVGDFQPAAARHLVMKYFGDLPKRPPGPERNIPALPAIVMRDRVIINYEESVGTTPMLVLSWLTPAWGTDEDAVADFVAHLLTRGKVGRLNRAFENDQDVLEINAGQQSELSQSIFTIKIKTATPQVFPTLLAKLDEVLGEIGKNGASPEEIGRIARWEQNRVLEKMYSLLGKVDLVQSMHDVSGQALYTKQPLQRFDLIDSSDVQKFIKTYLNERVLVHYVTPAAMPLAPGR